MQSCLATYVLVRRHRHQAKRVQLMHFHYIHPMADWTSASVFVHTSASLLNEPMASAAEAPVSDAHSDYQPDEDGPEDEDDDDGKDDDNSVTANMDDADSIGDSASQVAREGCRLGREPNALFISRLLDRGCRLSPSRRLRSQSRDHASNEWRSMLTCSLHLNLHFSLQFLTPTTMKG